MDSDFSTEARSLSAEYGGEGVSQPHLDLKRIIRLRAPLVIIVFLVLSIPSSIALWFLTPLKYEVTAQLRFFASTPRVMNRGPSATGNSIPYEKFLNTQIHLITGPAILSRVAVDPEVRKLPEVARQSDPLQFLEKNVKARIRSNSELVTISFSMRDKEAAKVMVKKIVDSYLVYALGEEANIGGERLRILMKERDTRQVELDHLNRQISELYRGLGVPMANVQQFGPSATEAYRASLARAEEDISLASNRVAATKRQLEEMEKLRGAFKESPHAQIFEMSIEERVDADPRVMALRAQLVQSDANLAVLSERFREGAAQLVVAQESCETLRREVSELESYVRENALNSIWVKLTYDLETYEQADVDAVERREKFEGFIDAHKDRAMKAAATFAELEELKLKVKETRGMLRGLRDTISAIALESNAPARVKLVSQPIVPIYPDYGPRLQLVVLALVGSFSIGMAIGVWRELTDQQIRSAQDILRITSAPILAMIPHYEAEQFGKSDRTSLSMTDFLNSPTADEYRRILSRIIYPSDEIVEVNTCLVVSPTQGDGKTSLSCNLAMSLAQANRRVLLVDVCRLHAGVEKGFGMEPGAGVAEILSERYSYSSIVRQTEIPNLSIVGPGIRREDLLGKLASREMMKFLEDVERDFDHVIIDSPPLLFMSDAKLLAPVVDGVILVVGAETSTLGMVKRCLKEMDQVNANLMGIVLNKVLPTRGGYLQKNLDLFYEYGADLHDDTVDRDIPEMKVSDYEPDEPAVMLLAKSDGAKADDER